MLTCLPLSKNANDESLHQREEVTSNGAPGSKQAIRTLTSQIKGMAFKASGACTGQPTEQSQKNYAEPVSASTSERFRWSYRWTGSSNSRSEVTGKVWGKEMEARLKGISSGERMPLVSASGRRVEPVVLVEENEPKEWVAQVETGVLITFVSLPRGGNDLKRIRFSREMFNKWQAQKWWVENYERVMELYNVQKLNRQAFPLPTPPRSKDEDLKVESMEDIPEKQSLSSEHIPRTLHRPTGTKTSCYSLSDSLDQQHPLTQSRFNNESSSCGLTATPKLSSISGTKTETSSMSVRSTSSSRDVDCSEELSVSNASTDHLDTEWTEQDEPGVYITIRALTTGARELRRVRFSRVKFGEIQARLWWEENRSRIHKQYL